MLKAIAATSFVLIASLLSRCPSHYKARDATAARDLVVFAGAVLGYTIAHYVVSNRAICHVACPGVWDISARDGDRDLDLQALQETGARRTRFLLLAVLPLIVVDGIDLQIQFNRRVVEASSFDNRSKDPDLLLVSEPPVRSRYICGMPFESLNLLLRLETDKCGAVNY